ncbi:MAG TPA: YfcE family phosphodiesterase [Lacipirellulaceae bacterium]|nr:YfcE family phosphodiesterase [Lacipirellulaceae bacterium]
MRLGVISDTHGHVELTRPAVRMFESLDIDAVLHCGDIGSMAVVELFAAWPAHFVFGNCDENTADFAAAIERAGQTCHTLFGDLNFDGVKVALLHSHDRRQFRDTISNSKYQLVCYGHTHVAAIDRNGDTVVLNPGAIYRANPHSIAVVELPAVEPTIIEL